MRAKTPPELSVTKNMVGHHTILIIEDDEGLNRLIAKYLRREGFETESVYTGEQTLSALMKKKNMILLMDYQLPDMTAIDVLDKLAEWNWMGPFVIMTGHGDEQIAVELMKQGAIDYIVKDANFVEAIPQKIKGACKTIDQERMLAKAEEALRESEDKFKYIFDHSNVGKSITLPSGEIHVNQALCGMLGYSQEEIQAHKWQDISHPDDIELEQREIDTILSGEKESARFEKRYIHKNGSTVWTDVSTSLRRDHNGKPLYFMTTIHNITKRRKAEEEIKKNLQEKEILIRELYHRTKNNMQVISSMLRLRARSVNEPLISKTFKEIENKILTMALVHEKLYESKDLSQLNLKDYINSLILLIKQNYHEFMGNITIQSKMKDVNVLIDTAVPMGLIINELMTNAIKHAFPDNRQGIIKVNLRLTSKNLLVLEISDNGKGLPENFNLQKDMHLGLQTVFDLAKSQLECKIKFTNRNGLHCRITLHEELYKPRI